MISVTRYRTRRYCSPRLEISIDSKDAEISIGNTEALAIQYNKLEYHKILYPMGMFIWKYLGIGNLIFHWYFLDSRLICNFLLDHRNDSIGVAEKFPICSIYFNNKRWSLMKNFSHYNLSFWYEKVLAEQRRNLNCRNYNCWKYGERWGIEQ